MVNATKKKTILIIGPVPPPFHGASYAIKLLIDSTLKKQYKLIHINTPFVDAISELRKFSYKKLWRFSKYLFQIIFVLFFKKIGTVIICPAFNKIAFLKDGFYTFICKKVFNKPVIWWVHGSEIDTIKNINGNLQKIFRFYFGLPNTIVTVGNRFINNLKTWTNGSMLTHNHYGLPNQQIVLDKKCSKKITVCYLSNMIESKGWKILFDAAQEISREHNNIQFQFYGKAENEMHYQELLKIFSQTAFKENICYFGPIYGQEKINALKNADIFCFPTYYPIEAFPIAILEAMQFGLPVITTNHAAIPEAIIDGKGGFIIPIKNKNALIEKILYLIHHPEEREKMGKFNQRHFKNHFTLEKHVERWSEIIEAVS